MADFFDLEKFPGRRGVFVPGGYLFALRFGLLGEDRFVWASDFPHIDAEYGPVA